MLAPKLGNAKPAMRGSGSRQPPRTLRVRTAAAAAAAARCEVEPFVQLATGNGSHLYDDCSRNRTARLARFTQCTRACTHAHNTCTCTPHTHM